MIQTRATPQSSRWLPLIAIAIASLVVTACGELDQSDVVKKKLQESGYLSAQVTKLPEKGKYKFTAERINMGRNAVSTLPRSRTARAR